MPTIVSAFLLVSMPVAWQAYSERRKKPLVQVHYWWVQTLDFRNLWLTPQVKVGLDRSVGSAHVRHSSDRRVADIVREIRSGVRSDSTAVENVIYPAFRLGTRSATARDVWALRVRIKNTSRRRIVSPEDFGTVRLTVEMSRIRTLGWRRDVFATWDKPPFLDHRAEDTSGPVQTELTLPRTLAPGEALQDAFAVVDDHWIELEGTPSVSVDRTASDDVRIRVKPWEPSTTRPLWVIPSRVVRWIRQAYKPKIYVNS